MDAELPTADCGTDLEATDQLPIQVCPRCSVQTHTADIFCPHCGAAYNGPGPRPILGRQRRRRLWRHVRQFFPWRHR
jgi:hypothetical protein